MLGGKHREGAEKSEKLCVGKGEFQLNFIARDPSSTNVAEPKSWCKTLQFGGIPHGASFQKSSLHALQIFFMALMRCSCRKTPTQLAIPPYFSSSSSVRH
jgi:hypothetical protein